MTREAKGGSGNFLPFSLSYYCNGGKPEPAHGGAITTPAAFTRTTPVSSTQYAVVPVEFNVTGVALTENPVSPDTPQAAGTPAVSDRVPLGVNVNV
jgi:hypothetical protein